MEPTKEYRPPFPKPGPKKRAGTKTRNRVRSAEVRKGRAERRSELRGLAVERSGGICEWSGCESPAAHMAHVEGIGLGGDPYGKRDRLSNVVMLCVFHHDLLDGRTKNMRLAEIEKLIMELIQLRGER